MALEHDIRIAGKTTDGYRSFRTMLNMGCQALIYPEISKQLKAFTCDGMAAGYNHVQNEAL